MNIITKFSKIGKSINDCCSPSSKFLLEKIEQFQQRKNKIMLVSRSTDTMNFIK